MLVLLFLFLFWVSSFCGLFNIYLKEGSWVRDWYLLNAILATLWPLNLQLPFFHKKSFPQYTLGYSSFFSCISSTPSLPSLISNHNHCIDEDLYFCIIFSQNQHLIFYEHIALDIFLNCLTSKPTVWTFPDWFIYWKTGIMVHAPLIF